MSKKTFMAGTLAAVLATSGGAAANPAHDTLALLDQGDTTTLHKNNILAQDKKKPEWMKNIKINNARKRKTLEDYSDSMHALTQKDPSANYVFVMTSKGKKAFMNEVAPYVVELAKRGHMVMAFFNMDNKTAAYEDATTVIHRNFRSFVPAKDDAQLRFALEEMLKEEAEGRESVAGKGKPVANTGFLEPEGVI